MVCTYCGADTQVVNSRPQKRSNAIWRRRRCLHCRAICTTYESVDLAAALAVTDKTGVEQPFSRDKLFLSIWQACGNAPDAVATASALTETMVARLTVLARDGQLDAPSIARQTAAVLKRFQPLVALRYASMHTESFDAKKLARGLV
jgi:transcriptional repressor NrdR